MKPFKPSETLTEQVARHLDDLIVFGQLRSGERIYETTMARELEVSHGSVREALLLLERRHLVRNVPRKGAFVKELDAFFVTSLYETLELILGHTSRKLARQWQPADMEKIESLYERMSDCYRQGDLTGFLDLGMQYAQASLVYADNYFILEALRDLWPSARRCAFEAFRHSNQQVLADNLTHMRDSIDAVKQRDEEAVIRILHRYATQQRNQVLDAIGAAQPEPVA
ncbi:GntR family transcriptional regulator [Tamilnaduibacter salinus]|uniref:GntR family transcriptional regulator n=1 Tax=Tamilnaduibacter salinus TaxID=1484056 RepID=A0A2A2I1Y0_9GAMM|nr:GntR family transcriptional regulator [Tamilnaduibacter salinus]PAV25428.1 GntR family transcriptional regulator [Tamilnaduibacter salinus]